MSYAADILEILEDSEGPGIAVTYISGDEQSDVRGIFEELEAIEDDRTGRMTKRAATLLLSTDSTSGVPAAGTIGDKVQIDEEDWVVSGIVHREPHSQTVTVTITKTALRMSGPRAK